MSLAVEFIREPRPIIMRKQYKFMIQTIHLTEVQLFTEAYLRGLISGEREETITDTQKEIINAQLQCDYERWLQRGQDLTPIVMNHRASVEEIMHTMNDVLKEIKRLETSRANPHAIGVLLDFAICCLKRTIVNDPEEWDQIQEIVDNINSKYSEVIGKMQENSARTPQTSANVNNSTPNVNQSSSPGYYTAPSSGSTSYYVPQYMPSPYMTPQYQASQQFPVNSTYTNCNNRGRVPTNQQMNAARSTSPFDRSGNFGFQNTFSSRNNSALIGPHKVSATIISIIGKNVYEPNMDALDQIQMWECQASTLHVPIEFFLSYMEILLSREMQSWWQLHRPNINSWEQFRMQFLEDFGDHNRVIKAEQAVANLKQGSDETFQQLFLRFTKLMSRVKPEKSEADKLYILRSSLKPELRAACMSVTTISDLKRLCQEYEGMQKMYSFKEMKSNVEKVCIIDKSSQMETDEPDFWNNEVEWDATIDDEDRTLVIEENLEKRKTAMSQAWSKEQKKEWLSKQICWNCDGKGHLQGQCNKNWIPHCVKCGNKKSKNSKECPTCSGNANPSGSRGAGR